MLEMCYLTKLAGGRITQIPVSCEDWRTFKFNLLHEALFEYSHPVRLWLRERGGRRRQPAR